MPSSSSDLWVHPRRAIGRALDCSVTLIRRVKAVSVYQVVLCSIKSDLIRTIRESQLEEAKTFWKKKREEGRNKRREDTVFLSFSVANNVGKMINVLLIEVGFALHS